MKLPKHIIIRAYLLYFVIVIAMLLVVGKTFAIIVDGRAGVFKKDEAKMPQRTALITPRRGEILDDKLNQLVTSVSFFDIYMDPITVKASVWKEGIGGLSEGLSELFGDKTPREYEEYLRNARAQGNRYILIQKRVTNEQRKKLHELPIFKLGQYKGGLIDNQETIIRKRPNGNLLARTLGYVKVNHEDTLMVGLEGAYNMYLAGQQGMVVEQRIANKWRSTGNVIREPIQGYDLVTSIDEDIQEVAHQELLHQLKTKGGKYGVALVMEVKTGFIKAMVNLQEVSDGLYGEVFNNAIGTREVPGSTLKLATLLAALEDGKIKMTDTVNAVGKYRFYDQTISDANYGRGYGKITIKEAFEHSSNVISKVVYDSYKDEPQKFIDRLHQFGLAEKTGIQLSGEPQPTFSEPGTKSWWGGSLGWMGIGYEYQSTPLQLLSFYNAVANDGKYMQPQLVKSVLDNQKVVKEFKPVVLHEKISSQESIDAMKDALEGVVKEGTGIRLQSAFFDIAGKTGTAQIANQNKGFGKEGEKKYVASFAGYFPAKNPLYSCLVVIAAPTNDIYGASVSGTVFSAIANKVYANSYEYHAAVNEDSLRATLPLVKKGSRYDINTVLNQFNVKKSFDGGGSWVGVEKVNQHEIRISDLKISKEQVPDVRGMGLMDALYLLEQRGMKVNVDGEGTVVLQSIAPGTKIVPGRVIDIKLK